MKKDSYMDDIIIKPPQDKKKRKKNLNLDVFGKRDDSPSFFDDLKFK